MKTAAVAEKHVSLCAGWAIGEKSFQHGQALPSRLCPEEL
jgi:hypothetical protein